MKHAPFFYYIITLLLLMTACTNPKEKLHDDITQLIESEEGIYAVAYKNLSTGDTFFYNEEEIFHAASTMKTPVMIELYKQAEQGKFSLNDSVIIKNTFSSIVDGSSYHLNAADDSEKSFYERIGTPVTLYELTKEMIISSSNLATNMLIELVTADSIKKTLAHEGIDQVQVLRGVEDSKAYALGLNNTTTAKDMMLLFEALYHNKFTDSASTRAMMDILAEQKFNEVIPALLPDNVKVIHKTGNITGVEHDAGIVFLPNGNAYVLVLLSRRVPDISKGKDMMARVSKVIYEYSK